MIRKILKYILLGSVYFVLYILIDRFRITSSLISTSLLIIIIILTYSAIEKRLNSIVYRYSLKFSKHLEKVFAEFDLKLNQKFTYFQLLDELDLFFNRMCKHLTWALYVVENSDFSLTKKSESLVSSDLPATVPFKIYKTLPLSVRRQR